MQQLPKFKVAPLASALAAVLGTSGTAYGQNQTEVFLEEVIVTARKRQESVMTIPASVQALTEQDLKNQGARGMADFSRFLPAVNVIDYGSGITEIAFRGATSEPDSYVVQATASVYLNEVSVTTQGQQPYIRMVDVERVESLAGPQGTLYGSDSTAGTLRILTNQPDPSGWEVIVDGSVRDGEEGEESYDGSLVFNMPLLDDKLALRVVGFTAKDGGFIDNVLGHTPDNDIVMNNAWGRTASGWGTLDNSDVVDDDINDFEVDGWRAALRWDINENWSATVSHLHQETESGAYASTFDPNVGDLEVIRFNDEYYDVEYDVSSLVIEADLGFAQLVSATSYYDSDSSYTQDVTNYQKSYAAYYCISYADLDPAYYSYYYSPPEGGVMFANADLQGAHYCIAPTAEGDFLSAFDEDDSSDRFAQEIRLSSQGETLDWLVGVFYEDSNYSFEEYFGYPTANENGRGTAHELFQQSVSLDFSEQMIHEQSLPDARTPWYADSSSDSEQYAVFGEAVWHINEQWDLTLGARYFDRDNETEYYQENPDTAPSELGLQKLEGDDSEFMPKIAVSYDIDDNNMVYALRSVGFRPGGTNRQRGDPAFPQQFDSDEMTNYELGWKGTLADGRVRVSLTGFYMDWEDFQFELTDPSISPCDDGGPASIPGVCGQPFQVAVLNAGDAVIMGSTLELDWAVSSNLVVGMNAQYLDAETDDDIIFEGAFEVPEGSDLPATPEWTGAAWATYSFPVPVVDGNGFVRLQWSYSSSRLSNLEPIPQDPGNPSPQFKNPSYDIGDLSMGVQGDSWEASIFLNNITDERAEYNQNRRGGWSQQNLAEGRLHVQEIYTNRPREYGVRIVKRWGGS